MKKKTVFKIISISLPFLIILIIEVGLRSFGYGDNYQLFNKVKVENRPEYLIMNSDISKKYFKNEGFHSDNQSDLFLRTKTDSTFRIFVQGASTVVGFPFYHGGSFPRMLKQRLSETFPGKNIEVVNTGITAVNSYTLWDLTDKIIEQKPDLVIIYAGHNEYYGALGVGSSSSFGSHPVIVRSYLFLKNFRFFQLLDNTYTKFLSQKKDTPKVGETTLMEVMAKEQRIALNSEVFQAGINQFEDNLEKILNTYKKKNIPVIISTIVSNEKDIKPFISDSIEDTKKFTKALNEGNLEANKLAQNNGMAAYTLGRFYLNKNQDTAKKYLHLAKELDFLRFRAPEKINDVIVNLAKKHHCSLVDMKAIFLSHSEKGIIGDELLTEHLHPNIKGSFIMADAFYNKIKELKYLSNWDNYISYTEAFEDIPITQIDSLRGKFLIDDLKNSWPYDLSMSRNKPLSSYHYIQNPTYEERRAIEIHTNQVVDWRDIMYQSYHRYNKEKAYQKGLQVAQSLIFEYPEEAEVYSLAGNMCLNLNKINKAAYYFFKCNELDKTSTSAQQLASIYIKLNKMDLAKKTLLEAKKRGENDEELKMMLKDITNKIN
ncbi:hypothetical protein QLS71_001595 [Mariniflexile litorale]|uniref:SGNH hydrolase-type esterase domain-containing protein n=1 Tax=Mariniflexile litorale TaxID=3045158 RepID=A0AAU7EHE7_9FLAO|nr:hypothetical protein [Mariniflexile sp. KMM 9835]MDQ8210839.1 hypothetical protein [Mariniflexile sp. KMM 9835]